MLGTRTSVAGIVFGSLGVLAFSLSLPATRVAVAGGLPADFIASGRAVIAACLALVLLVAKRAALPNRHVIFRAGIVALGIVFGFPVCTSLALAHVSSAHGIVVAALLPAATSAIAAVRFRERLPLRFWLASLAGLACVLVFTATQLTSLSQDDGLLFAAVAFGAVGYAEGGGLAEEIGSVETICLALVLSLPITLPVAYLTFDPGRLAAASGRAWVAFAYLSLVSMFAGFLVWYKGLALGGIARIGQLQLAQPLLSLLWSSLLLGEAIGIATILPAAGVLSCIVATQRGSSPRTIVDKLSVDCAAASPPA